LIYFVDRATLRGICCGFCPSISLQQMDSQRFHVALPISPPRFSPRSRLAVISTNGRGGVKIEGRLFMQNQWSISPGHNTPGEIRCSISDDIQLHDPSRVYESASGLNQGEIMADEYNPLQLISHINLEESSPLECNAEFCAFINQVRS
jgi:hypothetical protein